LAEFGGDYAGTAVGGIAGYTDAHGGVWVPLLGLVRVVV
jgi:hypothetical protein